MYSAPCASSVVKIWWMARGITPAASDRSNPSSLFRAPPCVATRAEKGQAESDDDDGDRARRMVTGRPRSPPQYCLAPAPAVPQQPPHESPPRRVTCARALE